MPGKRRFSGPLRPGTKSTRTRVAKKPRGGLNKTEKKQTKKIAEAVVKKEHALKYFDSNSSDNAVHPEHSTVANKKEISVIAFSSGTEFDEDGTAIKYGPQDYIPLYLSRPFKDTNTDNALSAQALSSQYAIPKRATCSFSIERVAYAVAHAQGGTANPTPNMARSLPISYRIVKVGFKNVAGTQTVLDLNRDLFISSTGQPTGIDEDDFDRLDCRYSPINTKKYTKLMDMRGTINQNNIITPSDFAGQLTDIVTQKNGSSMKHMTIPYMLSGRKNGKLFYDDANAAGTKTFTSGGRREITLMHFWYENGHTLLGGDGQPQAPDENDLQIKFKATSAFVDAQ